MQLRLNLTKIVFRTSRVSDAKVHDIFTQRAHTPFTAPGLPTMSDAHESSSAKEASSAQAIAPTNPITIESGDLFRGQREILIQHGDEIYRLRITRNEKLILHK